MHGTQALLATFSAQQQRKLAKDCNHGNIVIVRIEEAMHSLHTHCWHALLIDLSEYARAGFSLLERVLAAELTQELAPPALLLACSNNPQMLNESLLRLKGFDQLLSLPLCDELPGEVPLPVDLRELYMLAGQQQPVLDAMLPVLVQALNADIKQLETLSRAATLAPLADLAHRMKSSWHLLGMRRARRVCIIMERLPALINDGIICADNSLNMRANFIAIMFEEHRQLRESMLHH